MASNAIQSQLSQQVPAGLDYEKFMAGLLSCKTYSKELIDASEADATPFLKDPDGPTCAQVWGAMGEAIATECIDHSMGCLQWLVVKPEILTLIFWFKTV